MEKRTLQVFAILVLLFWVSNFRPPAALAQKTPGPGEMFPELKLSIPQRMEERRYLNVDGPFLISGLDAEVLIVQIFNIYCPYCRREAPNVNALQSAISARPDMKSRVKILAIGAGNTAHEVSAFRNLFRMSFPLIPDPGNSVRNTLGDLRTPYFFVLLKKPNGREVVYSREGSIGDPAAFLESISAGTGVGKGRQLSG